jgi:hypothetical protein
MAIKHDPPDIETVRRLDEAIKRACDASQGNSLKLQAVLCDLMVFFRDWSLEEVREAWELLEKKRRS